LKLKSLLEKKREWNTKEAFMGKKRKTTKIILTGILFIFGICMIYPFIWMVLSSFKSNITIAQEPFSFPISGMSNENYVTVFGKFKLFRAYGNSLLVAFISTYFVLVTSTMAGYIFAKYDFFGKEILFFMVLGILMLPEYVIVIPLYILVTKLNLLNTYTGLALPFLVDAFGVFLMRQFISSLPDSLIESARLDGASEIKIFMKIVLPLSMSSISVLAILVFLWNWDRFLWPIIITQSEQMRTLPVLLAYFNQGETDMPGPSMAACTIAIIPVLIVYTIFQKNFIKGIAMSGLKY